MCILLFYSQSFVQSFNSFLGSLDVQEDIFSLGSTSRIVANQLCFLEEGRTRRKVRQLEKI